MSKKTVSKKIRDIIFGVLSFILALFLFADSICVLSVAFVFNKNAWIDQMHLSNYFVDKTDEVKNKLNARLRIDGILMCRIDNRRVLDKDFQKEIEALKEEIGVNVFRTRIRETIKCRESQVKRTPLIFYAPDCTAEEDYENLVTELTGIRRK